MLPGPCRHVKQEGIDPPRLDWVFHGAHGLHMDPARRLLPMPRRSSSGGMGRCMPPSSSRRRFARRRLESWSDFNLWESEWASSRVTAQCRPRALRSSRLSRRSRRACSLLTRFERFGQVAIPETPWPWSGMGSMMRRRTPEPPGRRRRHDRQQPVHPLELPPPRERLTAKTPRPPTHLPSKDQTAQLQEVLPKELH